jgi:hypothetical protein
MPGVEEDLAFVRAYHLDTDATIRVLVQRLTVAPDPAAASALHDRLRPFRAYHREHPFVTAPPDVLTGPIILGRQTSDNRPVGLTTEDLNLHGTVVGPSGSGKTTLLLTIARWLLTLRILLAVIDVKEDFGWLLREPDVMLIDEHTPWNFLTTPSFLTAAEHRAEVIDLFLARFYGAELQRQVLDDGWERAAQQGAFSLHEWHNAIINSGGKESPARAEARQSAARRLARFAHYRLFTTTTGIAWDDLLTRTFVVRTNAFDDLARFQFDLLCRYAFLRNRAARVNRLERVIVIDEGYELLSDHQDGIRSVETLPRLKQLAREFGIGVLTTTVTLRGTSDLAQASTHFLLALPPNNQDDASALVRMLGLDRAAAEHFRHRLHMGNALLRIGTWPDVIHLQVAPNTERKHPTPDDIAAARTRTNQLAPSIRTAAAREEDESTGWQPPAHTPTATASRDQPPREATSTPAIPVSSSAQQRTPNTSHNTLRPTPRQRIALNKHATVLLHDIGDYPYSLCSQAYRRCELLLAQGDRARGQGERLGLLCATRVTCGRGRGKTGVSLSLTAQGWEWLGRTPTKGLRGGSSVQHSFCVFELHRRIPGSLVEEYLGAKAVDLAIPFNADRHERLYRAISALTGNTPRLQDGDIIALEVEISSPARSAMRNAHKDAAAGVALTVLAVDDRQPERLALTLPSNATVLDVYALLDALRTTEES